MKPVFLSPVVCNAGPLIGLARIHLEHLPFQMFAEVIVPEEVRRELLIKDSPDREQLAAALEKAHTRGILFRSESRRLLSRCVR